MIKKEPRSLIYGTEGLNSKLSRPKEREHERENQWNDNVVINKNKPVIPNKQVLKNELSGTFTKERMTASLRQKIRHKTDDKNASEEEIIMCGLYRLDDKQSIVLKQFTDMLQDFDPFDAKNLITDVFYDYQSANLIENYTGIDQS
jgi:hypothetical protein